MTLSAIEPITVIHLLALLFGAIVFIPLFAIFDRSRK